MSKINFFALGGLDENGKNCYVLEVDDSIFVINAGTKVPISSTNGVDTLIPNFSYLEKNQKKIKGIFLTDAKNESFSALPWLLMNVKNLKIYCSPFTKFLVLDRISKYKIGHKNYEIIALTKEIEFENVKVKTIPLAGSMPGIYGYNFETSEGSILILLNFLIGNLKIYGQTSINYIKQSITSDKGIFMLLVDSGRANYKGFAIDKIDVTPSIEPIFAKAPSNAKIIVGAYDEEMALLQEVLDLSKKYNRPVVPYGRTYAQLIELVQKIKIKGKSVEMPEFLDYKNLNKHENAVVLVTSTTERIYQRFLRVTEKNDVFLKINEKDTVIMIAPPVNGLEVMHALTLDEIARITPSLVDISENEYYRTRPAKEDIYTIVKELQPKYFVPLQGLYRYLVIASQEATRAGLNKSNSIVLQNGKVVTFIDGKLFSQKGQIKDIAEVIIDGFGIGDISQEVIKERENLARDGVISINTLINYKTKKLQGELQINSHGIVTKENKKIIHDIVKNVVYQVFLESEKIILKDTQEKIRKIVRRKIYKAIEKEPLVVVVFYEI